MIEVTQENDQLHVLQEPVAVTLTREQWHTVTGWLKYGADYHHAKMTETLANCQDQKTAGRIARGHELSMQQAESVRKIIEGVLHPAPATTEEENNGES